MDLIEDHPLDIIKTTVASEYKCAKNFRRHHEQVCVFIHHDIPGNNPDILLAKLLFEIVELLVTDSLQRGGVNHLGSCFAREIPRIFGENCLARTSGSCHHNRMVFAHAFDTLFLESIQRMR